MNLLHKVEEAMMQYGGSSRRSIGDFILKEKNDLHKYSLPEIADQTYTSKAAVVRFAQALGFSGWKEFVKAFTEEQSYQAQHYSNIDANFPFTKDSRRKDIINQLCSLQVESLLDTADLLDEAPLDECAALLLGSRRVAMFGLNPNFALAEPFKRKMLSIGRQVELPSQGNVGLLAHSLDKYDCAVIISYSGNSPTTGALSVLPTLKQRNVPHHRHHQRRRQPSAAESGLHPEHLLLRAAVQQDLHLRHRKFHPVHPERAVLHLLCRRLRRQPGTQDRHRPGAGIHPPRDQRAGPEGDLMHFLFYGADAPHPNRTLLRLVRGICFKRITICFLYLQNIVK